MDINALKFKHFLKVIVHFRYIKVRAGIRGEKV